MKKIFFIGICLVILPLYLFANDDLPLSDSKIAWHEDEDNFPEEPRGPFRSKNRTIEIGMMNINIGFSNDFLTAGEFFRKKLVLNMDEFEKGLKINFGVVFSPFYFNFNKEDNWGVSFSTGLDASGIIGLSGNMLSLKEAVNDKSDAGGAAFAELRLGGFFHVEKFKIKIKPALYYPIAYIKPDISYTYKTSNSEMIVNMGYSFRLYTAWPQENFSGRFNLSALPGVDFHLGAEYPLSEVLGLSQRFKFLDFDVGVDFFNIPLVPSAMKNYMEMSARIGSDETLDFFGNGTDWDSFFEYNDMVYREGNEIILRPFKMHIWADWRPFGILISFIPTLGFAVNPLYVQPFSFEGGIKARLDVLNKFIAILGVNFEDRLWKNSVDLVFNSRAFEFDLGVNMQSADFVKSWTGGGYGLNFGFKFGW